MRHTLIPAINFARDRTLPIPTQCLPNKLPTKNQAVVLMDMHTKRPMYAAVCYSIQQLLLHDAETQRKLLLRIQNRKLFRHANLWPPGVSKRKVIM